MSIKTELQVAVGTEPTSSSGLRYMINLGMSICNDTPKINLREASYKLDHNNKILLLKMIKVMLFGGDEQWDEVEVMTWIKTYHSKAYERGMNND